MNADGAHVGMRLERYVCEQLTLATSSLALHGRESRHGIHQGRRAIRRARAALFLGWEHPNAAVALALEQLKRANGELSELRDAHALVGAVKCMSKLATGDAFDALRSARKRLKKRRAQLEHDAKAQSRIEQARERIMFIAAGAAAFPWKRITEGDIRGALAATGAQVAHAQQSALAHPSQAKLHKWRRRLRRMLQQREACDVLAIHVPEDRFAECAAEQLGRLQDDNVLLAEAPRLADLHGRRKKRFRRVVRNARDLQLERLVSVVGETDPRATHWRALPPPRGRG